jgi:predicted NAD/FAD-binding protein
MPNASVLGAIRDVLRADLTLAADLAGGVHWVELWAESEADYPGLVLRWPRTAFEYFTALGVTGLAPTRAWLEHQTVEIWAEVLLPEEGEPLLKRVKDLLIDKVLSLTDGQSFQVYFQDQYLHPQVARNNAGNKQYSFCLVLAVDLQREK